MRVVGQPGVLGHFRHMLVLGMQGVGRFERQIYKIRAFVLPLCDELFTATCVAGESVDGDWRVFAQQPVFDYRTEAEDHTGWVAARVGYVLGASDFFALGWGHFGETECPVVVDAMRC